MSEGHHDAHARATENDEPTAEEPSDSEAGDDEREHPRGGDAERLRRRAAVLSEIDGTRRLRGRLVAKYARIERVRAALQANPTRRPPP